MGSAEKVEWLVVYDGMLIVVVHNGWKRSHDFFESDYGNIRKLLFDPGWLLIGF